MASGATIATEIGRASENAAAPATARIARISWEAYAV
jgi:hypothetical protein